MNWIYKLKGKKALNNYKLSQYRRSIISNSKDYKIKYPFGKHNDIYTIFRSLMEQKWYTLHVWK